MAQPRRTCGPDARATRARGRPAGGLAVRCRSDEPHRHGRRGWRLMLSRAPARPSPRARRSATRHPAACGPGDPELESAVVLAVEDAPGAPSRSRRTRSSPSRARQRRAGACAAPPSVPRRSRRGFVPPGRARGAPRTTRRLADAVTLRRSTMLKNAASSDWRAGAIGPLDEPRDHSQREHGRDGGHQHHVGRREDALGQQREARRAVEEHDVVVATERVEKGRDHAFRLAEIDRAMRSSLR